MTLRTFAFFFISACAALGAEKARNVILFLGDAGGIPTLHAASLHGHNDPQALYVYRMPHIGLMETSAADRWVTDSAAGMSAIVTGQKTNNGVISQSPGKDGVDLQTILEYAEEHGLSTGVITNMPVADATPAACYAHASSRKSTAEIFSQLASPKFGDGPEIVVGRGRKPLYKALGEGAAELEAKLRAQGYLLATKPSDIPASAGRAIAVTDGEFDPRPVVRQAIDTLSKNAKGYFLMVEWDMHTTNIRKGLDHVLEMDALIQQTAAQVGPDTLIIFTADHSFDLRVRGGKRGEPLLPSEESAATETAVQTANAYTGEQEAKIKTAEGKTKTASVNVRMEDGHTGEQVLIAAQGPGAEKIRGFMLNTDLFHVMMSAYGWTPKR